MVQELVRGLSKCPIEVGTFPHWLIINGKQPAIPENAIVDRRQPPAKRRKLAAQQKQGAVELLAQMQALSSSAGWSPMLQKHLILRPAYGY